MSDPIRTDIQADSVDALLARGVLAGQSGDPALAVQYFDRAIAVEPDNAGAHCNRGLALKQLRALDAALSSLDRAIALDAGSAIAHYSRAETYKDLGRTDDALAGYEAALAINPAFPQAAFRRGVLLQQLGRPEEAVASYDLTLRIKADHADAHANRALVLFHLRRFAEALEGYDRTIAIRPGHAHDHLHRGHVLKELNRLESALASYERAIELKPDLAQAFATRGLLLRSLGRMEDSLASFDRAIALQPDYAEAYVDRAYLKRTMNRFDEALADYRIAAAMSPSIDFLPGARLEASMQVCDWNDFDALVAEITAGIEQDRKVSHPFILLALIDSPRLQHAAARAWARHACPADESLGPIAPRTRSDKIRIGYFSSDFRDHPVSRLLAELIETHDRKRFEIVGFAFGPEAEDETRRRLARAFDRFIDVRERSNLEVAALSRSLDIDIAVDLGGYTYYSRSNIFALRAAPLQLNYLGYLGTLGADYIDYIVADRSLITPESECHFTEKVIYLPDCAQVNDRKRRISERVFTRAELGLPAAGFVFCCFNSNYKICPATFAAWMRIVKRVPQSVLLLYAGHDTVESNLRTHAAHHGVDPQRLIFGERLAPPEYLARYRAADLFLDTLPYNAGTTASDALWAGLPVLTLSGNSLAGRVATSLLRTMDLPELIAATPLQYEELAVGLASNSPRMAEIRMKLQASRTTSPLFDTPLFTRNLEAAYAAIHDRHQAGLPPDHIRF